MSPSTPPVLQRLDQPLPVEITGSGHGWFTRYRVHPVFSAAWARGRTRAFGLVGAAAFLAAALPLIRAPADEIPYGGLLQLAVQLFVPLLAGPWLAWAVRRRGWVAPREWLSLVTVMTGLVLGMLAFHEWGAEPVKQWLAEQIGRVDEQGKRKRLVMSIGVSVSSPNDSASAAMPDHADTGPMVRLVNGVTSGLVTFWLAGGVGLWGWRRERAGLAALARERDLAHALAARREAELRLSVLAAQVEPHFLFNTLAGVRSAIATDPARAVEMIDHLAEYLRAAIPRLRGQGDPVATLGEQLDIVRAYLGLMSVRMPRLHFSIEVPTGLLGAPCPPLMLISLAENAVKHGVEPKVGPARIQVVARRTEAGMLEVTVADDGAGFGSPASGCGLGLTNLRERLQQMHEGRANFSLTARPDGGVAATLTLPLD
jgi:hypothetical protein